MRSEKGDSSKGQKGLPDPRLQQLRKNRAVMETKRELGSEFFLNARVDAFHVMTGDPKKILDEAIRQGNAYAEAGGDCILYLNLHSAESIGVVVKEVKAPVSILAGPQSPSVSELQDLGVAQVMTDLFLSNREIGVAVIGDGIVSRAGDANTIVASGCLCCRNWPSVRTATCESNWRSQIYHLANYVPLKNRVEDRLLRQVSK